MTRLDWWNWDLKVKILENFLESITKRKKHLYDWWNWDLKK
jgi:hypothetical protein